MGGFFLPNPRGVANCRELFLFCRTPLDLRRIVKWSGSGIGLGDEGTMLPVLEASDAVRGLDSPAILCRTETVSQRNQSRVGTPTST